MISVSHWGQFDPAVKALGGFPPIQLIAEFSSITLALQRHWQDLGDRVLYGVETGTSLRMKGLLG